MSFNIIKSFPLLLFVKEDDILCTLNSFPKMKICISNINNLFTGKFCVNILIK